VEFIRREAQRYGVAIHHSELVGLIPQDALVDAAVWYTQLDQFVPEQILERRLEEALHQESKATGAKDFLDDLAAGTAAPGGGSAAAYSGAAGAALVAMVAHLTLGRKKYAEVEELAQSILEQAEHLRAYLTAAVDKDAAAFQAVLDAIKMPKSDRQEAELREHAIQAATLAAAEIPLEVARYAVDVLELAAQIVSQGSLNAISDSATASALARAAVTGAGYNVRINLASLNDGEETRSMLSEMKDLEQRAEALEASVRKDLCRRGGISI
jgi:glutamate formiminotransferase/formiminotetrahydrofolate cyclodeaminase